MVRDSSSHTAFPALLPNFSPLLVVKSGIVIPYASLSFFPSPLLNDGDSVAVVEEGEADDEAGDNCLMRSIPATMFPH